MKLIRGFVIAASLFAVVGCGPKSKPVPIKVDATKDDLKTRLEIFAKSGQVGSGAAGMKEAIESLSSDKKADLLKDFEQLKATKDPARIKEIATRMAAML